MLKTSQIINNSDRNIILDSIADGVFTVDMSFTITSMNRSAEMILSVSEKDAIGKLCHEVFHASICEHSCALRETLETGKNIINRSLYIVNQRGDKIPISISTALLRDSSGNIIGGVETFRDLSDLEALRKEIESSYTFEDIVSKNRVIMEIFSILPDIAESGSSILIRGASGTGKELVARAIHTLSGRKSMPFIAINCAALPDTLLESELFGYRAGAFTDARKDKDGKITLAEGGTLFLDEIGDMSPSVQVKLLRFLQEREYEPLGATRSFKADVRVIAATNRDLSTMMQDGSFREDLYYRLNVMTINLPPLAERREDIPLLVHHFIRKYNALKGKSIEGITDNALALLMEHPFPGNIRELENIIEHAFILCRDKRIDTPHLPRELRRDAILGANDMTLESMERNLIIQALERNGGSRSRAAADLGIDPSTLWRKMKRFSIDS